MAYEELGAIITQLEGKPIQISEAFLFKFGALLIAENIPPEQEVYQYTAAKELRDSTWQAPANLTREIRNALEKHPNVFRLQDIRSRASEEVSGWCTGMLASGSEFGIEVHLPRAQQCFKEMETPEQFNIICGGSYFAAYSAIDDVPIFSGMAHEFRELARRQIESSTCYKAPLFGPCPAHPDIIIIRTPSIVGSGILRSYEYEGDLYILCATEPSIEALMRHLFLEAGRYWHGYYELLLARSESIDLDFEIQNRFSDASEAVGQLLRVSAWKFWSVTRLTRRAALSIAKVHELIVDYHSECWEYDKFRRDLLNRIRERSIFSKLNHVVAEDCRRDFRPPRSITAALSFLEKQIEVGRNVRSLVLASILGAVLGAILTGVISLVASRPAIATIPATFQKPHAVPKPMNFSSSPPLRK